MSEMEKDNRISLSQKAFRIGELRVDPAALEIRSGDSVVRVQRQVMLVLLLLVENAGVVVERDMFFARIWPHEVPGDETLTKAISRLRKACRDTSSGAIQIETIPTVGYRLLTPFPGAENLAEALNGNESSARHGGRREVHSGAGQSKAIARLSVHGKQIAALWGAVAVLFAVVLIQQVHGPDGFGPRSPQLLPGMKLRTLVDSSKMILPPPGTIPPIGFRVPSNDADEIGPVGRERPARPFVDRFSNVDSDTLHTVPTRTGEHSQ